MVYDFNEVKHNLTEMTRNLSFRWSPEAKKLIEEIKSNPDTINSQEFHNRYSKILNIYSSMIHNPNTWLSSSYPEMTGEIVAYFSPEIKIEYLKALMSGGLGVLAGEVVESLGDIGVETIGVSLFYKNLWQQEIDPSGRQIITFNKDYLEKENIKIPDIATLSSKTIKMKLINEEVGINIWLVKIGKAQVILLEETSGITDTLYDQTKERINNREIEVIRLKQELILGRGGLLALYNLNLKPALIHMNEAHCIFAATSLKDAQDSNGVMADFFRETRCVFTTHTPVPAGMRRYPLNHFILLGLDVNKYWQYFVTRPRDHFGNILLGEEGVDLTFAAMILSQLNNAVSQEHNEITKQMFPEFRDKITGITNGVYVGNWQMDELENHDPDKIDLLSVKKKYKEIYIKEINNRALSQLDPDILTVTIARRITGYKQNDFILSNLDKLKKMLKTAGGRGIQIVFSGKSHPSDTHGQEVMKKIILLSKTADFLNKIVFVPEYDVEFARKAARGSDIWLSNPEEGKEACATSYMKAMCNGTIVVTTPTGGVLEHLTPVPDEAIYTYLENKLGKVVNVKELKKNPAYNGFYILSAAANAPEKYEPGNIETLYNALLTSADLYYNHTYEWVKMMMHAIEATPKFDIHEVAKNYVEKLYIPVLRSRDIVYINNVTQIKPNQGNVMPAGRRFGTEVTVTLKKKVSPEAIGVQLWYGQDKNREYSPLTMRNWEKVKDEVSTSTYRYWDYYTLPPGINYYTIRAYVKPSEDLDTRIYKYAGKPREDYELFAVPSESKAREILQHYKTKNQP